MSVFKYHALCVELCENSTTKIKLKTWTERHLHGDVFMDTDMRRLVYYHTRKMIKKSKKVNKNRVEDMDTVEILGNSELRTWNNSEFRRTSLQNSAEFSDNFDEKTGVKYSSKIPYRRDYVNSLSQMLTK
jgi:hypothetical protein